MPPEKGSGGKDLSAITAEIIVAVLITLIFMAIFGYYIEAIIDLYNRFLEWIYSKDWRTINRNLTIIFALVNIGVIGFIVYSLKQYFKTRNTDAVIQAMPALETITPKDEVKANWQHVQNLINSESPSDWNMAVLRADSLLDQILLDLGYQGETIADRLKIVDTHKLPSLDRVWSAHRLRNAIAHDPLEQHTRENLQYAIKTYEQALIELGLMEKKTDAK